MILSLIIAILLIALCFVVCKYYVLYKKYNTGKSDIYRSKNGAWTTFIYDGKLNLVDIINPNPNITVQLKSGGSMLGHNLLNLPAEATDLTRKTARVFVAKILAVKEGKIPLYFECPFTMPDGTLNFALCYIEYMDDNHIYSHTIEVNTRQLVDGRREFIDKALINGMNGISAAIYTKQYVEDDPRGYRYIFFSKQAKELFGNKDITKSIYWNQEDEDERDLKVINSGIIDEYELPIKNNEGKVVKWLKVNKKKVESMAGYEYVLSTAFDITTIKERELDYQKSKEKAVQSDQFKSAFLANMSHEIRTPLNAIVGFSRLIPSIESEQEREEYIEIVNTNNDLLLKLIEDILDLSKIEAGYISNNKLDFNLSQVICDLQKMFELRAKEGIKVLCDLPATSAIIYLDRGRIIQVITNFLSNSIKFTSQGYIKMGYKIIPPRSITHRPGIELYVEDTGKGIAAENIPRVFDRFEKFDSNVQGTGLGMAICKSIVDANNGTIWVESTIDKGTVFHVYLPDCVR